MTQGEATETPGDFARLQRSPMALASLQNAQQHFRNGRPAAAVASYRFLVQQFPGAAQLWTELGTAAAADLDYALADEAFQRALELAPSDAALLVAIGRQYYRLRNMAQTSRCFERAVEVSPGSADARMNLASWHEQNRQLDKAWESVETCLSQHPHNGRARYFKAFLLHGAGKSEAAETALRDLLKDQSAFGLDVLSNANHLLGVILDARGEYAEAFRHVARAKALRRELADPTLLEQNYQKMDQRRRELLVQLTPETFRRWRDDAVECPHPLALLGGAPRSGTTLIEQIIGAHPDILVFDESEAFVQELAGAPLPEPAWQLSFNTLDKLPPALRSAWIGRYFKRLLHETDEAPGARLLLDKNPSTTGSLHIWLRLFPQSKIIIALRDPRDVLVSCYFQNIPINAASVNFLSLERTARFYADCMDVWLRLRDMGGFEWIETRYEDVVANLESEGQRVTNFRPAVW